MHNLKKGVREQKTGDHCYFWWDSVLTILGSSKHECLWDGQWQRCHFSEKHVLDVCFRLICELVFRGL